MTDFTSTTSSSSPGTADTSESGGLRCASLLDVHEDASKSAGWRCASLFVDVDEDLDE
jgi:hypothetical protein